MSSFSLVRQPRKSRYCGHAVVAMFAGITLADAIAELGEKSATIGRIKRSLAKRGILFEKKPRFRYRAASSPSPNRDEMDAAPV